MMNAEDKSNEQLLEELQELQQKLSECEYALQESRKAEEKTRNRAEFLQEVIDSCDDVIQVVDKKDRLIFSSLSFERNSGFSREELYGRTFHEFYPPEDLPRIKESWLDLLNMPIGGTKKILFRVADRQGQFHHLETSCVNRLDKPIEGVVSVLRDVTDRIEIEKAAEQSDKALRTVFNSVRDAIFVHDLNGAILHLNDKVMGMFGLSHTEALFATSADMYYGPVDDPGLLPDVWRRVLEGESILLEWEAKRAASGELFHVEAFLTKIRLQNQDHILATIRDITERKQAEEQLRAALKEKEVLLREIHHRVKNNLRNVSSLLGLQARRVKDKGLAGLFEQADFRVRCISMVHEKLYQSGSLSDLNVDDYLTSLIRHLADVHGVVGSRIRLKTEIEGVTFGADTALPIGFITSELFTNALKHAFPHRRKGEIAVILRSFGTEEFELVVSDNGVGMPEDLDFDNLPSLGLQLVRIFAKQLDAELEIMRDAGTKLRVMFKVIKE